MAGLAQPAVDGRLHVPAAKTARRTTRAELPSALAPGRAPRRFALPALEETPLSVNAFGQTPVGTTRGLPDQIEGAWETLPDGRRIWRVALLSPGAAAMRVHFRRFSVGRGVVWIYSEAETAVDSAYTGSGLYEDGDFWSGTVAGDTLTVEYLPETPAGDDPPPFRIDALGHVWEAPPRASRAPLVAPCELDFKCYSQWAQPGAAVAHMLYLSDDDQKFYVCTGSLLNTRGSSLIPYFLSANHCINTDNEARSLQTYWFYETASCNGAPVTRSVATRIDGARLLVTAGMSEGDFSLLRLNSVPNANVWFAGWDPTDPPFGASLTGIHHPGGSFKRISFGQRSADRSSNVGGQIAPADKFYRVRENQGRIEGGSSGSPLFIDSGRVVGVLSHGPIEPPGGTACDIANFEAGYGRFSVMFPALRQFLEDAAAPSVTVTPQSLAFRGLNGVIQAPAQQTLRIETTSAAAVAFTLSPNAAWVRLARASGPVAAGAPALVDVTVDPTAFLTAGSYTASIALNAGTALPLTIGVRADIAVTRATVTARVDPNPVYEQAADSEGFSWFYDVRVTETGGVETRLIQFKIDGTDYSDRIKEWFGTDRLAPLGSISTGIRARGITVPSDRVFEFAGADATGQAWSLRITARFLGKRVQATLKATVSPNPVPQDPSSDICAWKHDVLVTEGSGIGVTLNRWVAGGFDLSSEIPKWFQKTRLDPSGRLSASLCWRSVRVPATLDFEVGGRDDQGNDVLVTASARFVGAPAQAVGLRALPERLAFSAAAGRPEALSAVAAVDAGSLAWSARVVYDGTARNWLTAFPLSGVGAGVVTVTGSAAGYSAGRFTATLIVEAAGVNPAQIPIALTIGPTAGARPTFTTSRVVNSASNLGALAPGMLFTIYGLNMAAGEELAQQLPLPYTMRNATVRINNVLCPLYYVASGQINAQIPYEIPLGRAAVTVNVEGRELAAAVDLVGLAPGVYTSDGTRPSPQPAGVRDDILIAYLTGVGAVSPRVASGAGPAFDGTLESLPKPVAPVTVTVAGLPAEVLFAGIPLGVAGVIQVNYRIPPDAPLGDQPLVFTVGGVRANPATLRVQ
ncbi:MAG: trypsin-like peptidase domain-containing protein [Candidatus Solibacter usitatus]|nr:trypsin-like peptidase domain-containing protein [Candidatus Solibacter usitatus]